MRTLTEVDTSLAIWMNDAFFEGVTAAEASKTVAAVVYCRADLVDGLKSLHRTRMAPKGFRKMSPGTSRLPVSFGVMALIVNKMMELGLEHAAVATILTFTLMLRPSGALRLRAADAVPPVRSESVPSPVWSFILHAAELGVRSKTGDQDESIVMDAPEVQFLGEWLRRRRQEAPLSGRLFDLEYL